MQQHPVPQNITGFEFKLIGFLTVRQFVYLGVAGITDIVLYASGMPFIIFLLIAFPISALAVALALFKINDQPFETWLVAFIKTIYSPTIRVWHREPKTLGFLEPQFSFYLQARQTNAGPKIVSNRSKLDKYLQSHHRGTPKSDLDVNEDQRLSQLPFGGEDNVIFVAPKLSVPSSQFDQTLASTQPQLQRMEDILATTNEDELT